MVDGSGPVDAGPDGPPIVSVGAQNPNRRPTRSSATSGPGSRYTTGAAVISTFPHFQGGLQPRARDRRSTAGCARRSTRTTSGAGSGSGAVRRSPAPIVAAEIAAVLLGRSRGRRRDHRRGPRDGRGGAGAGDPERHDDRSCCLPRSCTPGASPPSTAVGSAPRGRRSTGPRSAPTTRLHGAIEASLAYVEAETGNREEALRLCDSALSRGLDARPAAPDCASGRCW